MKTKNMQIEGFPCNFDKFQYLQEQYWIEDGTVNARCTRHSTSFDLNNHPCWQCWNECMEHYSKPKGGD